MWLEGPSRGPLTGGAWRTEAMLPLCLRTLEEGTSEPTAGSEAGGSSGLPWPLVLRFRLPPVKVRTEARGLSPLR